MDYANNDYWYDDTSDGSIDAKVELKITNKPKELKNREGKSWVVVAPPKYAPGIPNLVPLYQVIWETQHINRNNPGKYYAKVKTEYYRDIRPIFDAIHKNSWVNKIAFTGHGVGKHAESCSKEQMSLRKGVFSRVRVPKKLASAMGHSGQAYSYFMPPLSGNDGDVEPSSPDTFLTSLKTMAEGNFYLDESNKLIEYKYEFKPDDQSRYPKYKKISEEDNEDNEEFKEFEEIITSPYEQIEHLKKSALEWTVPKKEIDKLIKLKDFKEWTCRFRTNEDDDPKWGNMDMVKTWNSYSDWDLYDLNVFSESGNMIGNKLRYLIHHVVVEEMLNASLVTNLCVAVEHKPIFYSQESIPFYSNPLSHVRKGKIMVNLLKADLNNIFTFVNIERPDDKPNIN
ncbi:3192_t:CDS:10 [Diversispora eburnea]|uniref:3192_t:CDS:1 n=1 Tax=Diversispora eburnea TaxID=1213867 RepID=A0A9N9BKX2_9GLOM|nr:3192_t:CDS:10 [Diversispora eburnea]